MLIALLKLHTYFVYKIWTENWLKVCSYVLKLCAVGDLFRSKSYYRVLQKFCSTSEAYSELCQLSKMECFVQIVNG